MKLYLTIIMLCFSTWAAYGQNDSNNFFTDDGFLSEDTSNVTRDTLIQGNTFFKLFTGTPGKAALLSLLIPGGGQAYNKSWWKVPIAIGIDVTTISFLIYNTKQYKKYDEIYLNLLNGRIPDYLGIVNPAVIKSYRDQYRKYREYSYIWLIAGHLVTVFDAFVTNHLQDFDVSDDLSLEMRGGDGFGNRLSLVLPLHTSKYKTL